MDSSGSQKIVNLYFTGGMDSTLRLCQLARSGFKVKPWYLLGVDGRQSIDIELAIMPRIASTVEKRFPWSTILPIEIVDRNQIPKSKAIDLAAAVSSSWKKSSSQYQHMARHSIAAGIIADCCVHRHDPEIHRILPREPNKVGFNAFLAGQVVDHGRETCRVKQTDNLAYSVYRNLRFPILHLCKREIVKAFEAIGCADIARSTHSCWFPTVAGQPCGHCGNCKERSFNVEWSDSQEGRALEGAQVCES